MIEQEKKQQIRQKVVFLVLLAVGCLGAGGFAVSRGISAYQNNEKFLQVDAEEKFSRQPQYLLSDLAPLKDADSHVRYVETKALSELQAQEAIPQLTLLLKGSDQYVRYFAAEASGKLQSKGAIPQLTLLLKELDSDVRFSSTLTSSNLQGKEPIPQFMLWLKDANSDVRFRAIHSLGTLRELQGKESIPQLMLWLKDTDLDVHSSAVKSSLISYVKNNQNHNSARASAVMLIRQNLYQELILLGGSGLVILVSLLLYSNPI
jgi:HEAT repeat protein